MRESGDEIQDLDIADRSLRSRRGVSWVGGVGSHLATPGIYRPASAERGEGGTLKINPTQEISHAPSGDKGGLNVLAASCASLNMPDHVGRFC